MLHKVVKVLQQGRKDTSRLEKVFNVLVQEVIADIQILFAVLMDEFKHLFNLSHLLFVLQLPLLFTFLRRPLFELV